MKKILRNAVAILATLLLPTAAHAQVTAEQLAQMTPQQFLAAIRDPLRTDAWSVITGRITHARTQADQLVRGNVRLSIRLSRQRMITQITLNENNTYILEQTYDKKDGKTSLDLEMPQKEVKPSLFDFGLQPDDLSFAFFYWDYKAELTTEADRQNGLRILQLANPREKNAYVNVAFNAKHGFPMEAIWKDDKDNVQRTLELKGAKRHKNGVWFVREMRLEGGDKSWKTQVKFDYVEKNKIGQ